MMTLPKSPDQGVRDDPSMVENVAHSRVPAREAIRFHFRGQRWRTDLADSHQAIRCHERSLRLIFLASRPHMAWWIGQSEIAMRPRGSSSVSYSQRMHEI